MVIVLKILNLSEIEGKKNNLRKMLKIDSPIKKKIKIEEKKPKKVLLLDYD